MSYHQPNQQPWVVYNPWVFADYGQPQRQRGYVSPVAFTTQPPQLGAGETAIGALGGVLAIGFLLYIGAKEMKANRRRKRRRRG